MADVHRASTKPMSTVALNAGVAEALPRVLFGLLWMTDAIFKWQPAFRDEYLGLIQDAAKGQPAWLGPWFTFFSNIIAPAPTVWAVLTALLESFIALALIFGFARKLTYIVGAVFSFLIWSTAEGFGQPYDPGATDPGGGIVYVAAFLILIGFAYFATAGASGRFAVDRLIETRVPWWHKIAEVRKLS